MGLCSSAQVYRPFLKDSVHWHIQTYGCSGACDPANIYAPGNCYSITDDFYKIDGDTMVNDRTYKKLVNTYQSTSYQYLQSGQQVPCWSATHGSCTTIGILSEDTAQRKVFVFHTDGTMGSYWCIKDSTLFDFSKRQGDTMYWQASCSDTAYVVDTITYEHYLYDSVRTFHLRPVGSSYFGPFLLYESIGAECGFYGGHPGFEGAYETVLTSYCVGTDSACGFICITGVGINDVALPTIYVYPNPMENKLVVETSSVSSLSISVSDVLGREILQRDLPNATNTIDVKDFPSGIYYYQLMSGTVLVKSGKTVKE